MATTQITGDEIRALAEHENHALREWDAREPQYDANDQPIPDVPDDRYWVPLGRWIDGYDPEVLPKAAEKMQALVEAYSDFNMTGAAIPPPSFWAARKAAYEACIEKPPPPRFEASVAELTKQGVRDYQICRMWEMMHADGTPDFAALQQERDKPGSVIDSAWKDRMAARQLSDLGWGPKPRGTVTYAPKAEKKAEASIEDLLRSGCNIDQIVRIKTNEFGASRITESGIDLRQVVIAIGGAMGISVPLNARAQQNQAAHDVTAARWGEAVADGQPANGPTPRIEPFELDQNTEPVVDPSVPTKAREAQVMELYEAGNDIEAIASETGFDETRVRAIIATAVMGEPNGSE